MKCDECGYDNKEIAMWQDKILCKECFNKLYPVKGLSKHNMTYLFKKYEIKKSKSMWKRYGTK